MAGGNPFKGNPFADMPKPSQEREKSAYGPFALPMGKNQFNRFEREGDYFKDKQTGKLFNEEQFLKRTNEINNFLMGLVLEYHWILSEMAVLKPSFKDPAGAGVLRFMKWRDSYNELTDK
jgi:hypothetical protein